MARAVFQESLSEHSVTAYVIASNTTSWLVTFTVCLPLAARAFHVSGYIHQNIPLNLGHASTPRLRLPWQQTLACAKSCSGNGRWCSRWWPWMYLPYLTRPELCVTLPWRQRDMTQLLPQLCACVDSRVTSTRCRILSTLRASQPSDRRHVVISSEIRIRPRLCFPDYFVHRI
jgi:hypothetical protein